MSVKTEIRTFVKKLLPCVSVIEVGSRVVSHQPRITSVNALDWPEDADLFDMDILSRVRVPRDGVLDCWLYSGRGEDRELEDHAAVTVRNGRVVTATLSHWSDAVKSWRNEQ